MNDGSLFAFTSHTMDEENEYTNNKAAAAASVVTTSAMFPLHEFMVQSQSNSEDEPSV